MGGKDCGNHGPTWHKEFRSVLIGVGAFIAIVALIVLIVFLVLRPTKPTFALHDATVMKFNLSSSPSPSLLTSTLQVSIFSRNPNKRVGIYYDRLDVYAAYKYQQITLPVVLPPSYQGTNDISVWSPFLYGVDVPIAPYLSTSLGSEEGRGILLLHIRLDGQVRWKVGTWKSGGYHINVECPAILGFYGPTAGDSQAAPAIKFQQISKCNVDV